jgi:hypothetical protein
MGKQPPYSLLVLQPHQDLIRLDDVPLHQLTEFAQRYQILKEYDRLGEIGFGMLRRRLVVVLANLKYVLPEEHAIVPLHAVQVLLGDQPE